MLVSIALGIFILCTIYVVVWSIKNDAARSIAEQVGFIRMRVPRNSGTQDRKRSTGAAVSARPDASRRR